MCTPSSVTTEPSPKTDPSSWEEKQPRPSCEVPAREFQTKASVEVKRTLEVSEGEPGAFPGVKARLPRLGNLAFVAVR